MNNELENELKELEQCFKENGYTEELIKEIKMGDGAETTEEFIDNLQEEQSCWDC